MVFTGGIQLVSYTSVLATLHSLPAWEEVGKKAFLGFHSYLCKPNEINCFPESSCFSPLVGSATLNV